MGVVRRYFVYLLALIAVAGLPLQDADAAKKKKKRPGSKNPSGVVVQADEVFSVTIQIPLNKKKNKSVQISCRNNAGGAVATRNGTLYFSTFQQLIKFHNKKGKKGEAKAALYRKMSKAAGNACQKPDFLSLEPYNGPFNAEEAHIIWDRFAFGASPTEINESVANGLDWTISRLTNYLPEPQLDLEEADLRCDSWLFNEEPNRECDPEDLNDVSTGGVVFGIVHRMLHTSNPFFHKFFMWLHDERITAATSAASGCGEHYLIPHVEYLRSAARTGDYKQAIRDAVKDYVYNLSWLDGASNHAGLDDRPNENFAREFLELLTVGPTGLNGVPNYGDYDIAQAALAFSGNDIVDSEINGHDVCLGSFVPHLHAPGPKVIFAATPYETVVYNEDDMIAAVLQHPRLAEHLAEDLWKEFIGPLYTSTAIRELAAVIVQNNYNLLPVMRRIMKSRAMFAARNRKALIKHPVDLMIGFMRTTKMPYDYRFVSERLGWLGQQLMRPSTVFGWNERTLAGEQFVLDWRNIIRDMVDKEWFFEEEEYELHPNFVAAIQNQPFPSRALIAHLASMFGIPLNAAQVETLNNYMNFYREWCHEEDEHPECVAGSTHKLVPDAWDPHPLAEDGNYKLKGLMIILTQLPGYRMK